MKNKETHLHDSTKKETMYITSLPERAIFWTICLFILILLGRDGTLKDKPEIIVNNICECVVLLICSVLISIIAYNAKRKRIFIKANAHLIKAIGIIVSLSGFLTSLICNHLFDSSWTLYYYPKYYLMIIGMFIAAIGYIFQIAIKIKEEQDLTI